MTEKEMKHLHERMKKEDPRLLVLMEKCFDAGVMSGKEQAQRTWVGLTDEDKKTPDMGKYVFLNDDWIDGYKTGLEKAEAKLKEKNT